MKHLLLLMMAAICCLPASRLAAQTHFTNIPMTTVIGNGPFKPRVNTTNLYGPGSINFDSGRHFQGIPADLQLPMIKEFDFQPEQGMYELYKRLHGAMSPQVIAKELGRSHTDTLSLSSEPIRHTVHVLCGFNTKGKRVVIADANNNLDFGDDICQVYDTAGLRSGANSAEISVNNVLVAYQYACKGRVYDRKINLKFSPFSTAFRYSDEREQEQYLVAMINEYRQGSAELGGTRYRIACATSYQPPFIFDSLNTAIIFEEAAGKDSVLHKAGKQYNVGDTLLVSSEKYSISIDRFGENISLRRAGKGTTVVGSDPGQYAYAIVKKDLAGVPFQLDDCKGKYVLLDFWGSWCKPCIASIPDLVGLYKNNRHRLVVVSIAYDDRENMKALKELISAYGMNWTHLFEDMKDKDSYSIIKRFKVTAFPTQILIDPTGKIILRAEGMGKSDLIARKLGT